MAQTLVPALIIFLSGRRSIDSNLPTALFVSPQRNLVAKPCCSRSLFLGTKQRIWPVNRKMAFGGTKINSARLSVCASQGWEGLMRKTIARLAIIGTAICSIVLISFPSFPSTLGTVYEPQVVDRALKGDRLTNAPAPAKNGPESQPSLERAGKRVPMGCDRAFSSMSSRQFSTIFGRCLV